MSLFLSMWLLVNSCSLFEKKEAKNALPAATQEGKHTFGCKADGQIWLPCQVPFPSAPIDVVYEGQVLDIKAGCKNNSGVVLEVYGVTGTGTYPLQGLYSVSPTGYRRSHVGSFFSEQGSFDTDSVHTGSLTLTRLDMQAGIISGTFSFTGYSKRLNKTIQVTEGRFDVKLF